MVVSEWRKGLSHWSALFWPLVTVVGVAAIGLIDTGQAVPHRAVGHPLVGAVAQDWAVTGVPTGRVALWGAGILPDETHESHSENTTECSQYALRCDTWFHWQPPSRNVTWGSSRPWARWPARAGGGGGEHLSQPRRWRPLDWWLEDRMSFYSTRFCQMSSSE